MKLLFLTKRRPQNRDLFTRPYGRFYNIPRLLAEQGADVHIILSSYKSEPEFTAAQDGMTIYSKKFSPNVLRYYNWANERCSNIQPDAIIAFSDIWFGILAAELARRCKASLVIDAYDNYEAYIPWAKPAHWLWRRAIGKAHGLSAAGPQLLDLISQHNPKARKRVIPMAADSIFQPLSMAESRQKMGLPSGRKLVGHLGTADSTRGFDQLVKALQQLMIKRDDFDLVLSGRSPVDTNLPVHRVHQLGYISDELMPVVLNSCDLLVCINKESAFGKYSYPIKIYEALACAKPVVTNETAATSWILEKDSRALAKSDSVKDMAEKIGDMLDNLPSCPARPGGWKCEAEAFNSLLQEL